MGFKSNRKILDEVGMAFHSRVRLFVKIKDSMSLPRENLQRLLFWRDFWASGNTTQQSTTSIPKAKRLNYNPLLSLLSPLQKYLRSHGRAVDTWLIMGTKDSKWSALDEAVEEWDEDFTEFRVRLDEETHNKKVEQPLLDEWSRLLTNRTGLTTRCYLSDGG